MMMLLPYRLAARVGSEPAVQAAIVAFGASDALCGHPQSLLTGLLFLIFASFVFSAVVDFITYFFQGPPGFRMVTQNPESSDSFQPSLLGDWTFKRTRRNAKRGSPRRKKKEGFIVKLGNVINARTHKEKSTCFTRDFFLLSGRE
ncbi:hypothetical protein MAPG_00939 [Magnaporthiopsis poae ATCC 64411]|uniref:Uncharacterized protein n=1 Tax=Magnaporthiopsis poae (strain ATCC 64411 / 73-15) TaxID=644358 RepID=A0A0C4DMD4_MAGP6|nr:hypothetical protein MAPG_00939 [Magnaporthiopsis poae ATCC 64411]